MENKNKAMGNDMTFVWIIYRGVQGVNTNAWIPVSAAMTPVIGLHFFRSGSM